MKKLWMLLLAVLMACAGAAAENEDLSLGMTGPKVLERMSLASPSPIPALAGKKRSA